MLEEGLHVLAAEVNFPKKIGDAVEVKAQACNVCHFFDRHSGTCWLPTQRGWDGLNKMSYQAEASLDREGFEGDDIAKRQAKRNRYFGNLIRIGELPHNVGQGALSYAKRIKYAGTLRDLTRLGVHRINIGEVVCAMKYLQGVVFNYVKPNYKPVDDGSKIYFRTRDKRDGY